MTVAHPRYRLLVAIVALLACLSTGKAAEVTAPSPVPVGDALGYQLETLQRAVADLVETFGSRYPNAQRYLETAQALQTSVRKVLAAGGGAEAEVKLDRLAQQVSSLRSEALLANPLLDSGRLLLVKRMGKNKKGITSPSIYSGKSWNSGTPGREIGLPSNHECNSSLERDRYDNEIAILSPLRPDGKLTTLYRPSDGGYVGEIDLHWDADRLLFSKSDSGNWKIWEMRTDGSGLRQVSQAPSDVDCFDACYLPSGQIIFGSTACYQAVPCWHGLKRVTNLYSMNADGSGMRQLCFDQDHDLHPCVMLNGQVLYSRWEYTGISHIFLRELMAMNPDGSGQRALYGSNSWFPNSLYFPQAMPGSPGKILCILTGYHGVHRMGQLVVADTNRGWHEAEGLVQRISGRGDPIRPAIRDILVDDDWPKFLHPFPLSDKYFLVSCWMDQKSHWGIYLADAFDNLVLVREEPGYALLEPVPIVRRPVPPVIPDRTDPSSKQGVVYLHDVYAGPGLAGVPRGTVKSLRVIAYHFGYPGLAGPDLIGYGGPWEVMRILGTVPVAADGSAVFHVPAKTPLAVQALDAEGKAVQLMRSWFTLQPGEKVSCVGCHERPADAPSSTLAVAARQQPREITPWYGPPRGFDFDREVQPVLNTYCVGCHDGQQARPDLRPIEAVENYRGRRVSDLAIQRMHPQMLKDTEGTLRYRPAYDALLPYVRRVEIEDDVSLLVPGEFHADTSELVQLLRKGHQGVALSDEAWQRLVTWIDLNAPCHGTWGAVYPIPDDGHRRRMELRRQYGGPEDDPEAVVEGRKAENADCKLQIANCKLQIDARALATVVDPSAISSPPLDHPGPLASRDANGSQQMSVDLGDGVTLKMVRIPAGAFVMGDAAGEPDERPLTHVSINRPFWMGAFEVTNAQYRRFDPRHDCRYYGKRHARSDDQGLPLNTPEQPVVRVSWNEALAFCRWLSGKTGLKCTLPTEAQWEYACRAGSATPLCYGSPEADFTPWANVADRAFKTGQQQDGVQITGGLEHLMLEGAALSDARFHDGAVVTAAVGSYRPNAWGLYDVHGNAAEWTRSAYRPHPYRDDDGRNDVTAEDRRVVRGGSFFDRPYRCRSAYRLDYPAWQRVFNVGFRVVCEQ